MKVLLSWLREFVDVPATAEEIGARMSLRGFALEGIEKVADDEVLDFDVTSNRPDCMNVVGIAREVAAAYGQSLNRRPALAPPPPMVASRGHASTFDLAITIENADLCRCYAGAVANEITVRPSPDWMQARLKASGIRPISNIVDITNYVLLELGQPMHAFDLAKLGGAQIRVRNARSGEKITTLDGQTRELSPDMLVVADAAKPVAIAGVMGGADSEVGATTTAIVFESAYFNPLSVRRTARTLGMKTEASMRFERGTDRMLPPVALLRALTLLEEIGAGKRRDIALAGHPEDLQQKVLPLRRRRIRDFLGATIPDNDVFRIIGSLGFSSEPTADGWNVTVPPRRIDIHREVDLIEEVARHYGFERIPSRFPALAAAPPKMDPRINTARALRSVLTGAGFSEA
ncbi:MAG TPA: phenylalanine--tRNA ligase subunit beta, partial [Vicinamibacterales bacterium]|nr:phenylalanine--tRNA ligase subunit beta [Vicinamibacterales bacterium]